MRAWPASITFRLACWFALVSALTFAGVGAYLYHALDQALQHRDDEELIGKIALTRNLLRESASIRDIERAPHQFMDAVVGHEGLILRLARSDGSVILLSATPSRSLPNVPMVPAGREPAEEDIRYWHPADGPGRVLGAVGLTAGPANEQVHIVVAREALGRSALLRSYGWHLAMAVGAGVLLAAGMGAVIARFAMRPIRVLALKANEITTQRLDTRLVAERAPTELREFISVFNAMLERLEEGVQRLSQFSAELAHDLRTPINTLMLETQVVLSRMRSVDEYQTLLAANIEEYERLARMIENTLFLARAENARLALRWENVDVESALRRIRDYFEGLAEEVGVAIHVATEAGALRADRILFERAVSNLVSNAIRHTPRGGAVRLSACRTEYAFEVTVHNTGPGITAAHLPRIFDRYYRIDSTQGSESGLGLAIVRAIMQLHGGEVRVESVPGEYTAFCLCFPFANSKQVISSAD